jgi:hypothetical protein
LRVPDEGYSRNAMVSLNSLKSSFLLLLYSNMI